MDEKLKKKENKRNFFIKAVRKQAKPRIAERRKELAEQGKEMTTEDRNKIIKEEAKRVKKEFRFRAIFASIGLSAGLTAGIVGTKLLNEPQNRGITQTENTINIDAIEAGKDVYIQNEDKDKYKPREIFLNNNKVDLDAQTKEIKENVTDEISELKTKKDVLDYVKDSYAEEYNQINGTQITKKDIAISKELFLVDIKKDRAQNGDEILRYEPGDEGYSKGLYKIQVKTENGIETQMIARDSSDQKVRVYDSDEEVDQYKENEASRLANIIMAGTDYGIALEEKENNTQDTIDKYKGRFINSITGNRQRKINKIIEGKTQEKSDIDNEIIFESR